MPVSAPPLVLQHLIVGDESWPAQQREKFSTSRTWTGPAGDTRTSTFSCHYRSRPGLRYTSTSHAWRDDVLVDPSRVKRLFGFARRENSTSGYAVIGWVPLSRKSVRKASQSTPYRWTTNTATNKLFVKRTTCMRESGEGKDPIGNQTHRFDTYTTYSQKGRHGPGCCINMISSIEVTARTHTCPKPTVFGTIQRFLLRKLEAFLPHTNWYGVAVARV